VLRYVERNPLRAGLVRRAQRWRWSSLGASADAEVMRLDPGPVARPAAWAEWVNQPQTEAEVEALRVSLERGRPYGTASWTTATARRLGLESTVRPRGRPRKAEKR
jgi:putative transposase